MHLKDLIDFKDSRFIFDVLTGAGKHARFIGGCVRDVLLGREVQDIDIATTFLPDEVEKLFSQYPNVKVIDIGKEYGTVMVVVNHHSYEITTLRRDVHTDGRYAVVEYTDDWEEDAARRDFTINGMSYSPLEDKLYDYFNGQEDLKAGLIKFIGDPHKRVEEDYLRILRLFRFYTYCGKIIDHESFAACKKYAVHMDKLSKERKMMELYRIIADQNYIETLELMETNGILEHVSTLPDWKSGIESCIKLEKICSDYGCEFELLLRIFTLFHKNGLTPSQISKEFITLSQGEKRYLTALSKLVTSTTLDDIAAKPHYFVYHNREIIENCFLYLVSQEQCMSGLPHSVFLANAGIQAKNNSSKRSIGTPLGNYLSLDPRIREEDEGGMQQDKSCFHRIVKLLKVSIPSFPLTGTDLMSNFFLKPGKELGRLLDAAKNFWIDSEFEADKASIIAYLKQIQ